MYISPKKTNKMINRSPLLCWDIYSDYLQELFCQIEDSSFLEILLKKKTCSNKENMLSNLKKYDAIIVSGVDRKIKWVSHSFTTMTGYLVSEAIGKKPSFLHGKKTNEKTIERIHQKLECFEPIDETLINYKKSGIEYYCKIYIEPIFDNSNQLTEFIAFEKEL